jgi:hypothetical protein
MRLARGWAGGHLDAGGTAASPWSDRQAEQGIAAVGRSAIFHRRVRRRRPNVTAVCGKASRVLSEADQLPGGASLSGGARGPVRRLPGTETFPVRGALSRSGVEAGEVAGGLQSERLSGRSGAGLDPSRRPRARACTVLVHLQLVRRPAGRGALRAPAWLKGRTVDRHELRWVGGFGGTAAGCIRRPADRCRAPEVRGEHRASGGRHRRAGGGAAPSVRCTALTPEVFGFGRSSEAGAPGSRPLPAPLSRRWTRSRPCAGVGPVSRGSASRALRFGGRPPTATARAAAHALGRATLRVSCGGRTACFRSKPHRRRSRETRHCGGAAHGGRDATGFDLFRHLRTAALPGDSVTDAPRPRGTRRPRAGMTRRDGRASVAATRGSKGAFPCPPPSSSAPPRGCSC